MAQRNFAKTLFHRMLTTTTIAAGVSVFASIADTVLAGHLFGKDALAGVNLIMPINSFVLFVASLIGSGATIYRSIAVGKCDRETMDKSCSTGLWAAVVAGILLASCFVLKDFYFDVIGVSGIARRIASDYCNGFWMYTALTPLFSLMSNIVSSDGGHLHCRLALVVNVVAKIGLSIVFAKSLGIVGLPYASAIASFVSIALMALFLRSKSCTLVFSKGFSRNVFIGGIRFSILDQLYIFGEMLKMLVINIFVVAHFGESFLPVVSAFTAVSMLTCVQSATANALQPVMGVYLGERNYLRVREISQYGLTITAGIGLLLSVFILFYPSLITSFIGLSDPALLPHAHLAVRIAAAFLVFVLVCGYADSYYLYTEHFFLSGVLCVLDSCLMPVLLGVSFGCAFRETGFWTGLAIAPLVVMLVVLTFVWMKFGREFFPFLLPRDRDARLWVFDLELNEREITAVSQRVMEILQKEGLYEGDAVKAPLIVEEALLIVKDRNGGRPILGEVTLDLNEGVALTLRDDGEIFDLTDSDASVSSLRSYLVANVMASQQRKFNLVTTGINRNCFRF